MRVYVTYDPRNGLNIGRKVGTSLEAGDGRWQVVCMLFLRPTRVAAPSPRASLGRRTVCGRTEQRRPPVSKRYETKVRMVWGSFLISIAAAALKTPTRNGYNAQGVNLTLCRKHIPSQVSG